MRSIEAQIELGKTTFFEGYKITPYMPVVVPEIMPGDTAIHEAMHAYLLIHNRTGVSMATIKPEGNSLGHTIPKNPDIEAAMGPHSKHMGGTSHDVWVASHLGNPSAAAGSASAKLDANSDKYMAIARGLQSAGTLTGNQMENLVDKVDNPDPQEVSLVIESPLGTTRKLSVLTMKDRVIDLSEEEIIFEELPKAA